MINKEKERKLLMLNMSRSIGLDMSAKQEQQLLLYLRLLTEVLPRQRIIGTRDENEIIAKHIYDCLYPIRFKVIKPGKILDLGSGAGLPGIPLKIFLPAQEMYLMDSNRRKINFLQRVIADLKMENTFCLLGRAEDWAQSESYRELFTTVISRAVAATAALAEMSLPLTRIGGHVLLYKGPQVEMEVSAAQEAIKICGGETGNVYRYKLTGGEERTLLCLDKVKHTPGLYPRRAGRPEKKPLGEKKNT